MGEIAVSFRPDLAPNHVRNFLRLAEAGVYDGMSFHRVVKGFVIQTAPADPCRAVDRAAAGIHPALVAEF